MALTETERKKARESEDFQRLYEAVARALNTRQFPAESGASEISQETRALIHQLGVTLEMGDQLSSLESPGSAPPDSTASQHNVFESLPSLKIRPLINEDQTKEKLQD